MAITGSTRMQATTIQLSVLLTVLEMVLRNLRAFEPGDGALDAEAVPPRFLAALKEMHATLSSRECLCNLAG